MRFRPAIPFLTLLLTWCLFAQDAPSTFEHPWRAPSALHVEEDSKHFRESRFSIELDRTYSLGELIDLAEAHNPETRVAWESARAEAAALGIARSELYPALTAVALSGVDRSEVPLGSQFYRQTVPVLQASLDLNYTIFDFGARRGRITAESARVLAANFTFNDVHRKCQWRRAKGPLWQRHMGPRRQGSMAAKAPAAFDGHTDRSTAPARRERNEKHGAAAPGSAINS